MGWGEGRWQWKWEWECKHCGCRGNYYNRETCRRCKTPWWKQPVQPVSKVAVQGVWNQGMPAWLKEKRNPEPEKKGTEQEEGGAGQITAILNCIEALGEEEGDLLETLTKKLEQLKTQGGGGEPVQDPEKELAALRKRVARLGTAITSLEEIEDCAKMVQDMMEQKKRMEERIADMTKKPAEERYRSLQDKKAHRQKLQQNLAQELQEVREKLESLELKSSENSKELEELDKEMKLVKKEMGAEIPSDRPMASAPMGQESAKATGEEAPPKPRADGEVPYGTDQKAKDADKAKEAAELAKIGEVPKEGTKGTEEEEEKEDEEMEEAEQGREEDGSENKDGATKPKKKARASPYGK